MRVVFVDLPWRGKRYAARAGVRWAHTSDKIPIVSFRPFPFFMATAAAAVEAAGHPVKVIDALTHHLTEEEFLRQLKAFHPDVLVCEISTPSYANDIQILKDLKAQLGCRIIATGQHPSALPEHVAKNAFIDHVLVAEFEFTLLDLLQGRRNEKIIRQEKLAPIDSIPWPARHLFDMSKYNESFCDNYPNVQFQASRGCMFRCSFCNIFRMFNGRNYRFRNPQNIIDEMKFVVEKYNPKEAYFDDDMINGKPLMLQELARLKAAQLPDLEWSAMGHTAITRETLELLKKSNLVALKFGVESPNDEVLKRLQKGTNVKLITKTLKACKELGIRTHCTYTIGLPGETLESARDTLRFALKHGDSYQISLTIPFPGTPLYDEAVQEGWLEAQNWDTFDGLQNATLNYPGVKFEDLKEIYDLGQISTYRKAITSGEYKKYIRMIYQESGIKGLAKLVFVRGPGMAKSVFESMAKV
ncbi:MAG: radical SAM protein [Nanoarchaeota archaeon]